MSDEFEFNGKLLVFLTQSHHDDQRRGENRYAIEGPQGAGQYGMGNFIGYIPDEKQPYGSGPVNAEFVQSLRTELAKGVLELHFLDETILVDDELDICWYPLPEATREYIEKELGI